MRPTAFRCLLLGLLLVALPVRSQNVNMGHPEEISAQKLPSPEDIRARVANAQFQKDAKEFAELCASIPADMDGLRQGVLSRDLLEKLKRVEKLSKRVRQGLMP